LSALKAIQKRENTLLNTSKILGVSPEQVENTTERLAIDLKETRREREKLMERIAEFTAKEFLVDHSELSGLKLITRVVKEENVSLMVKIADIIVTLEPLAVVIFFLIEKTVHVVIMVGKEAAKRNVNANKIASALASILGGGGSGDSTFAQGGGPLIKNVSKAVQEAGEIIIKQLGGNHIIS
jgi:alanyl-tRNA synthetase